MAVSATPPPSFSPLRVSKDLSLCCPNLPFFISPSKFPNPRRQSVITLVRKQKDEMAIDKKRELLEQYGLNPDEFLTEQAPKPRRREKPQKMGSGKEIPLGEFKGPRETHKLLQVLGGKARRMKLLSPKGMDVRPMMEVVKGAAFGILQVAGGCPASLRPGKWLDLFSGTGSVGIEAISRGCAEVHFVEMDPWVISDVLRPNLEWTGFLENSIIHAIRVENFLERAEQFVGKNGPFEYISVTPPYTQVDYKILMNQLSTSCLVGPETFILVEYALGTDMLDTCGVLVKIADRRFGRTNLAIYGPTWAEKKRKSDSKLKTTVRVLKNM